VDEGSDALGILSCVNIRTHSKRPSIQAISSMLLRRCPKDKQSKIENLLSSSSTALVVSSRILNVFLCVSIVTIAPFFELYFRCPMRLLCLCGRVSWKKYQLLKRLSLCFASYYDSADSFCSANFNQTGNADYQLSTLLLLCPVVVCDDGTPFYMRGEEEVFCANSEVQFSFQGEISCSFPGTPYLNLAGAIAGHTISAVFVSLKSPNVTLPASLSHFSSFSAHALHI
jgi:hypothetical protein